MSDLTPEAMAELRRLLAAATPGQWEAEGSQVWGPDGVLVAAVREHSTIVDRPDAALIAAAVNALPPLLDAAELANLLGNNAKALNDVLPREVLRQKAEAWDEGYTRGFYDREQLSPDMPGRDASEGATPNPYRQDGEWTEASQ